MKHVAHITLATGDMVRREIDALSRADAVAKAFALYPAGAAKAVSAWPIREVRAIHGEVRHRVASPLFDSSFGCLA